MLMIVTEFGNTVQRKMIQEKNITVDNGFWNTVYGIKRCSIRDQYKLTIYVDVLRGSPVMCVCGQYFIFKNKFSDHGISFSIVLLIWKIA